MSLKYTLALIIIAAGCQKTVEQCFVTTEDLKQYSVSRECDTLIRIPKDSVNAVCVIDGVYCFIENQDREKPALSLYDSTMHSIGKYAYFGTGVDQMISPSFHRGGGFAILLDVNLGKLIPIDIDMAVEDTLYHPTPFKSNIYSCSIVPWGTRWLLLNPYKKGEKILLSDSSWNVGRNIRTSGFTILTGSIAYGNTRHRIVFCPKYDNIIEWFDENRSLVSESVFSLGGYSETDEGIVKEVFSSMDADEETIAVVFRDDEDNNLVLLMDWQGRIIDGFIVNNTVKMVSVDTDNNRVFCWETESTMGQLTRYRFNKE